MSMSELAERFVNEIKLRAYDDKYIDKNEEREILKIAIEKGVSIESARSSLAQICEQHGYVIESQVLAKLKEVLETFFEGDGMISEKEFNDAVTICKKATQGKRTDIQCKKMVIDVMEENQFTKIKHGFFSNWFAKVKKDLGVA